MKVKKGDTVVVISGKDKGRTGEVMTVLSQDDKVIVQGVNTASKHQKARRANQQGGIIDRDMPIHVSNVMLVHKGKRTRAGYEQRGDEKVRVARGKGKSDGKKAEVI